MFHPLYSLGIKLKKESDLISVLFVYLISAD